LQKDPRFPLLKQDSRTKDLSERNQMTSDYPKWILELMEKDKPSASPIHWAKKGCRRCYGRGTVGLLTQNAGNGNKIRNELLCSCVQKAFSKWQDEWYSDYLARKNKKS
jgi:hypothetical protein